MKISRRQFLHSGLKVTACAPVILNHQPLWALNNLFQGTHHFLHIMITQGLDNSYGFDARPFEFTKAQKIQNFVSEAPFPWPVTKGSCLASPLVKPLLPFKDKLAVINGVTMAVGNDGHDENTRYAFCGNTLGNNSFIPFINADQKSHLDFLEIKDDFSSSSGIRNRQMSLSIDSVDNAGFIQTLKGLTLNGSDPELKMIDERYMANANVKRGNENSQPAFAKGSQDLSLSIRKAVALREDILKIGDQLAEGEDQAHINSLRFVHQFFQQGIARSAILFLRKPSGEFYELDMHDNDSCKTAGTEIGDLWKTIAASLDYLEKTPYQAGGSQSLLDVTTVLITTEFSRTMRQLQNANVENTGTDHNPLNNTVLMIGKGIKGGQVVGASDLDSLKGNDFARVSKAHKNQDPGIVRLMGKPFDFKKQQPIPDALPETFDEAEYINFKNVANTVATLFKLPTEAFIGTGTTTPGGNRRLPALTSVLA